MLAFSLALTPIFAIILFVYFQDKYSREPTLTLFTAFVLGIISVFPAIVIELFYEYALNFTTGINPYITVLYAFFGVGLTEELCKFMFLKWYIYKNKNFDEPMDGVVYAVMVSMGFAAVENIFYVFSSNDPTATAITRSLTAVPAHACFGIIMGLYFGLARFTFKRKRFYYLIISISFASIAHGFYNVFLFIGCKYCPLLTVLVLIVCVIISLRIISRFKKISPFKKKYLFLTKNRKIKTAEELEKIERRKTELRKKLQKKLRKKSKTKNE